MTKWNEVRHQVAIAGKVKYAQTGRNIEGATVQASGPSNARTRTAQDGLFYFLDLPDGHYSVQAFIPGSVNRYPAAKRDAEVSRDEAGRIRMATLEIAMEGTSVKGRISATGHKSGLAMAEVRIKGSGERVFSDAQGQYLLAGIEPGSRVVLVYAQGYKPACGSVKLKAPGVVETLNFALLAETGEAAGTRRRPAEQQ